MIINSDYRKCVTYLYQDLEDAETKETRRSPVGTAFFVCVPVLEGKGQIIYIVTARHVVRFSRPNGKLFTRVNMADGSYVDIPSSQDDWIEHPQTDIALCLVNIPAGYDAKWLPVSMFESKEFVTANNVSEGDDIFFCGMFRSFPGRERMQPIIRFGNISLMPYEQIHISDSPDDTPYLVDAYLIEARSWGGHSGSPAFIYFKPDRTPGKIVIPKKGGGPHSALLGLVSSHYEIPAQIKFKGDVLGKGNVDINAGIAVVIPARFIYELLFSEDLIEQRNELLKPPTG